MKAVKELRDKGIKCELYPDAAKMKKQMAYADALKVPYVAIIGGSELEAGTVTLKNMADGTQKQVSVSDLAEAVL